MTHFPIRRLALQVLEDRRAPATGTFVEDFTSDYNVARGGYDSARDGVQISTERPGAGNRLVPTPSGGPAGLHSLSLTAGNGLEAYYAGWTYHTSEAGGLAPWEMVAAVSVTVRGGGSVRFYGLDSIAFINTAPPDQWVTFSVTKDTVGEGGIPLGEITTFRAGTFGQMLVDDVNVEIGPGPLAGDAGEVRVSRFGNGLSVTGGAKSDLVRVELLYDAAGTVRVTGLAGTRVTARTPGVTQVSDDEVEVPGFAQVQTFDGDGKPTLAERDLFIRLAGGDDWLEVAGADLGGADPATRIDDLFIASGLRDSIVSMDRVLLWDALVVAGGPGQDTVAITGRTIIKGINVRTGAGDDTVQIGQPGALVFDGASAGAVDIRGRTYLNTTGVIRSTDGVYTGPGRDTVLAAGLLQWFTIDLGGGPDRLRLESARTYQLWLVPGAGIDLIELIESDLDTVRMTQDSSEFYRLHRVEADGFQFAPARSGVRFQLPASE